MEGRPFGPYRLQVLLGRGGMGEVWRAHDTVTNRTVAVKLLPPHLADDTTFVQRFRREAEAAAQLNNAHVIPIHTYGEIDGRLFVDMRLIEGRDLQSVLADGPLEPARAVRIIDEVARALHAAHKVGLVHRDVKPSNILLDEDDFAYLIDFGIARTAGQTGLTGTGAMIGTWHYMAPERLEAREADARSDIYALACVLHECLTGRRPFPGESLESQVTAHLTKPPPRPSATNPNLPAQLDAVIATGMAKQPDQRYPSTVELARAARDAVTVPTPRPAPQPAPELPTERVPHPVAAPTVRSEPPPQPWPKPFPSAPAQPAAFPSGPTRRMEPLASPAPSTSAPAAGRGSRRKALIISAAAIVFVIAVALAVTVAVTRNGGTPQRAQTPQTQTAPTPTALPFTGLAVPEGVAVDSTGTVYVADRSTTGQDSDWVLALAKGSSTPTELPFGDYISPRGVAVDSTGTVYVTQVVSVLALAKGSSIPTELPLTDLDYPHGVAVDSTDTLYVTALNNNRVVALAKGASTPTELPFTGLKQPSGVAVDNAGTVYVTDSLNDRVVALAKGASTQTELPFTDLDDPYGVAVDGAGTVYVTDSGNGRVVALAKGSGSQTTLLRDLGRPQGVAVDSAGTVYVADSGNDRVLAFHPQ